MHSGTKSLLAQHYSRCYYHRSHLSPTILLAANKQTKIALDASLKIPHFFPLPVIYDL